MSTLRANTLKPITSGNSLVLQGDSGGSGVSGPSIDSNGDVDFTQNTNAKVKLPSGGGIYESDGSTEILTESGGAVTLKNTAIDTTVTFPDGMVVDKQYYKYSLSSPHNSYLISSSNLTVATRTSSSNASAQNITIEAEHTYIYEFLIYQHLYRFSDIISNRKFNCGVYEGTTQVNQGSTSLGTKLSLGQNGRVLVGGNAATADQHGYYSYTGGIYYGSGATTSRYVYLAADSESSQRYLINYMDATYPMYLVITKIKGNKATDVT